MYIANSRREFFLSSTGFLKKKVTNFNSTYVVAIFEYRLFAAFADIVDDEIVVLVAIQNLSVCKIRRNKKDYTSDVSQ